jgi:hypothetical protein
MSAAVIDTVLKAGGNNASRLLIVTGYATDITGTINKERVAHRQRAAPAAISVHYTPRHSSA